MTNLMLTIKERLWIGILFVSFACPRLRIANFFHSYFEAREGGLDVSGWLGR